MLRRLLSLVVLAVACVAAGCGSSASHSSSALTTELSYFPPGSPFVMTVVTDPKSDAISGAKALVKKFPIAGLAETALIAKLQQRGIDFNKDVRPLFGNPVAFGLASSQLHDLRHSLLLAWVTKDAGAVSRLVRKLHARRDGSRDGAALYQAGPVIAAVDGATVVIGGSVANVAAALDRHAHGGGISSGDYSRATAELPSSSLVTAFGDLSAVLATPRAAKARRIPWVAALKGYAAALNASSAGISLDFRLDTTAAPLSLSQLPIAPGATAPALAGTLPIVAGVRDPGQVIAFIKSAVQAVDPPKYAEFLRRQADVRRSTGVDLNSLLRLVKGDLSVESDLRTTMVRAAVTDPRAAASVLAKLASHPQSFAPHVRSVRPLGGGFYAVGDTVVVGVSGDQLVGGKATADQLRAFAAAPAVPAAGAQGAVAFRISLPALFQAAFRQSPSPLIQAAGAVLGEFTGWLRSSPSGVTGHATLAFK